MNRILINPSDIYPTSVTDWTTLGANFHLKDSFRLDHLSKVVKLKPGNTVRVCLLDWGNGTCLVKSVEQGNIELELIQSSQGLNSPVGLVLGLCRPPSLRKVVEHATGMGVTHFYIVCCDLSEKSYLHSKWFSNEKLNELFSLGLAQDHSHSRLPKLKLFSNFFGFLEMASELRETFKLKMILDQDSDRWMESCAESPCFAIGPERGFTSTEIEQLIKLGFETVKVSQSVLRVEHACFHGLAQWEYCRRLK